jgi:hypothetical protein
MILLHYSSTPGLQHVRRAYLFLEGVSGFQTHGLSPVLYERNILKNSKSCVNFIEKGWVYLHEKGSIDLIDLSLFHVHHMFKRLIIYSIIFS